MLQGEHSAILLTFIKLPFVIKTFGKNLSNFEWPFYPGFIVLFPESEKQLNALGFKVKLIVLQPSFVGLTLIGAVIGQRVCT